MGNQYTTARTAEAHVGDTESATNYTDVASHNALYAFTGQPCKVFTSDGKTRMIFESKGKIELDEDMAHREHEPMWIRGFQFRLGQPTPTVHLASIHFRENALEILRLAPSADIIVDAAVAPHIPAWHKGDIYTVPQDPERIRKDSEGNVVGVDGLDLYRWT